MRVWEGGWECEGGGKGWEVRKLSQAKRAIDVSPGQTISDI